MADGSRNTLASKPSEDGELWVCYLEKECIAWALLTGCKGQNTTRRNKRLVLDSIPCNRNGPRIPLPHTKVMIVIGSVPGPTMGVEEDPKPKLMKRNCF